MSTAIALQSDTTWLRLPHYDVAPLNVRVAGTVPEVELALGCGVPAYPDANRENFYDIELPTGWAYIHVHDDKQTVYVVAYSVA